MKKISWKIFISILITSFISLLIFNILSVLQNKKSLNNEISEKTKYLLEINGEKLDKEFSKIELEAQFLSDIIESNYNTSGKKTASAELISRDEINVILKNEDIEGVYFYFDPRMTNNKSVGYGQYKMIDGSLTNIENLYFYNLDEQKRTINNFLNENSTWTEPENFSELNKTLFTYKIPVYDKHNIIGVLGISVDYNKLKNRLKESIKFDNYILVNSENKILVSSTATNELENLDIISNGKYKELSDNIKFSNVDEGNFKINNENINFYKLDNSWYLIGIFDDESLLNKGFYSYKKNLIVYLFLILLLVSMIAYLFSKLISRPIKEILNKMKRVEHGGLHNKIYVKSNDEFEDIGESFNSIITSNLKSIKLLKKLSDKINKETKSILERLNYNGSGSSNYSTQIKEIEMNIEDMDDLLKINREKAFEANKISMLLEKDLENIEELSSGLRKSINDIRSGATNIENTIEDINKISFQTNILALNSSLEVNKMSSKTDGFERISSEILRLSNKTGEFSNEIKEQIKESVKNIEDGYKKVNLTTDYLNKMIKEIHSMSDLISDINNTSFKEKKGVDKLVALINNLNKDIQEIKLNEINLRNSANNIKKESESINKFIENIESTSNLNEIGGFKDEIKK